LGHLSLIKNIAWKDVLFELAVRIDKEEAEWASFDMTRNLVGFDGSPIALRSIFCDKIINKGHGSSVSAWNYGSSVGLFEETTLNVPF